MCSIQIVRMMVMTGRIEFQEKIELGHCLVEFLQQFSSHDIILERNVNTRRVYKLSVTLFEENA